jgi:predicted RNA binding protein YcfA (HicA-like mRNA interferase family)
MVSEEPTRKMVKELRDAGFVPIRKRGSHTWWEHSSGIGVPVPDGHRTISPGVVRSVRKAIEETRSTWTGIE